MTKQLADLFRFNDQLELRKFNINVLITKSFRTRVDKTFLYEEFILEVGRSTIAPIFEIYISLNIKIFFSVWGKRCFHTSLGAMQCVACASEGSALIAK